MWHPDQVPPSKIRRMGTTTTSSSSSTTALPPSSIGNRSGSSIQLQPQQPPICPHCKTKFASHNNLRRHIIEVHKRHELDGGELDKDGKSIANKMDRVGECVKCKLTFSTLSEWIEHKINDARESRSLTNYEWNCNICMNKKFTRKDRCMQHMLGHANDRKMDPAVIALHKAKMNLDANGDETSNQEYETSNNSASSEQEEQEEAEEQDQEQEEDQEEEADEDDEEADEDVYGVDDESEQSDTDVNVQDVEAGFPCQLCQVTFMSAIELKRHASEHFLNGGIDLQQDAYVDPGSDIDEEDAEDDDEDEDEEEQQANYEQEEVIEDDGEIEIEDSSIIDGNNDDNSNSSNSNNTDTSSNSEPKPKSQQQPQQQQQQQKHFAAVTMQSCKICGGQCENQAKVISCMSSHQTTSNWKCSECQLFFISPKQLNAHEKLCH